MGAAVAAQLQRHEITVLWHPAGRSDATTHRATAAGLTATTDLTEPLERAHIVLSIYPPAAAEDIAAQAYQVIYVDANAISPSRMLHIATTLTATGTTVIDAAIISPPPINGAATRIYLAGDHTDATASPQAASCAGSAPACQTLSGLPVQIHPRPGHSFVDQAAVVHVSGHVTQPFGSACRLPLRRPAENAAPAWTKPRVEHPGWHGWLWSYSSTRDATKVPSMFTWQCPAAFAARG